MLPLASASIDCIVFPNEALEDFELTDFMVHLALSRLKIHKLRWSDGFHPRILATLAGVMAPYVTQMFRRSLDTASIHADWKAVFVYPFYILEDRNNPGNCWPVCMISVFVKVLEGFN